jgi:hypothetical protein
MFHLPDQLLTPWSGILAFMKTITLLKEQFSSRMTELKKKLQNSRKEEEKETRSIPKRSNRPFLCGSQLQLFYLLSLKEHHSNHVSSIRFSHACNDF